MGGWYQKVHETLTILKKTNDLTNAKVHAEYKKIQDALVTKAADKRFKEMVAKDIEMKRRNEFVRGVFFSLFEPEYEGKIIKWNTKLESPHPEHKGLSFTLREKFTGDMSSDWTADSVRETQKHLIKRHMDRTFEWTYYTPGRKGAMPRWYPKIKLKLKPGALK